MIRTKEKSCGKNSQNLEQTLEHHRSLERSLEREHHRSESQIITVILHGFIDSILIIR